MTVLDALIARALPIPMAMSRRELAAFFAERDFTVGAEVGVWKGLNAETLCASNPALTRLYCVDPWAPQSDYREKKNDAAMMQQSFTEATERLAPYTACVFLRMPSVKAAALVADGSLDFVYIDGNHRYEAVTADIEAWAPKVRPGGVVAGHDFLTKTKRHIDVERAVRDYTSAHAIAPWFVLAPAKEDAHPSWLWVQA